MVEINPFKALRLNGKNKTTDVSKFICPPYDVISEEEHSKLLALSPTNVVRLEYPGGTGDLKYLQASTTLRQWKEHDVLQRDRKASYYLLETRFKTTDPFAMKSKMVRYGVLAALRLEAPNKGHIRPHEKTLPKAKEDRMNLLNSVQTNISPIFGLFFDKKKEWRKWVGSVIKSKPIAAGSQGTMSHRLWKVEKETLQDKLTAMLKPKELFIADGHHRYEVSWAYKEIRMKQHQNTDLKQGWQFVMSYVCPIEEPGLLMLPTHRLIKSDKKAAAWIGHIDSFFDKEVVPNTKKLVERLLKTKPKERVLGWIASHGCYLLKLKPSMSLDLCLAQRPAPLRSLDVVLLHDLVLEESRGVQYVKDKTIFFMQDIEESHE